MGLEVIYKTSTEQYRIYSLQYLGAELCIMAQEHSIPECPIGSYELFWEYDMVFGRRMLGFNCLDKRVVLQYVNKLLPLHHNFALGLFDVKKGFYRSKLIFEEVLQTIKLIAKHHTPLTIEFKNI